MAVTVLLDDGTGSDNGIVSVLTPVNLPLRTPAAHVALQLSSATSAGLGSVLVASAAAQQPDSRVVLHVGSVFLALSASTARILSRTIVAVSACALVWRFPVRATALIVTLAVVASALELSWLAARVCARLSAAYDSVEAFRERIAAGHGPKADAGVAEALLNIRTGANDAAATPMLAERASEADSAAQSHASALPQPFVLGSPAKLECLIAPIADQLFCGRRWVAALALALPLAGLLVFVEVTAVREWGPVATSRVLAVDADATAEDFAWSLVFLSTTRLAAGVCSLLAPSALCGLLLLAQLELFSALALLALSCRTGVAVCASSSVFPVLAVGVGALVWISVTSSSDPVAIAVGSALTLSGFLWIHCAGVVALSLIPSRADDSASPGTRDAARNLLVVTIAAAAAAEVASLVWQATASRYWGHSTPIRRQLSASVDVEGALVGTGCSAIATVVLTQLLALPNGGPVLHYVLLALAAAAAGRAAELLHVMLRRAAGGGRSPVLDHSAPLLASAVVFAQYARAL